MNASAKREELTAVAQTMENVKKPKQLNDYVYDSIKKMILNNELPVGAQIKVEQFSTMLGVSRTPVRESLIRLQADGLLESKPHAGFRVASISEKGLKDMFEVRRMLECYAAERCVTVITDAAVEFLNHSLEESRRMMQNRDLHGFNECEVAFHNTIIQSLENQQILQIWNLNNDMITRQRQVSLESLENQELSLKEHAAICRAISLRDAQAARMAMYLHLTNVETRLLKYLKEHKS